MIKNTTLLILVAAIVLGGAVYYFNSHQSSATKPAETLTPLFSIQTANVTGFEIAHPAKPDEPAVRFERNGEDWRIVQPIDTDADQSSAEGIVDQVAAASVSQTEPGAPDRLKAYGLDPAAVSLQIQLKGGPKHTILMGDKDFTGSSVYSIVDGGKAVSLLPNLLLTSCDKPVDELRDHTALHLDSAQVASFTLKNGSGELAASKMKDQWKFSKPENAFADADGIQSLLSAVANARMVTIVNEKPANLAKYGLATLEITFTATNDVGHGSTLIVSKKMGENYYARDLSRPTIFSVTDDLHMQLAKSFPDLRDKKLAHFDPADLTSVEIHNDHGTITVNSKPDGSWQIESAGAEKGKTALLSKILDPLTTLQGDEVIDHPGANMMATLAKPGIEIDLTDSKKNRTSIELSKPMGDVVYARTSDGSSIYKLKKDAYDSLNFDATQILP